MPVKAGGGPVAVAVGSYGKTGLRPVEVNTQARSLSQPVTGPCQP